VAERETARRRLAPEERRAELLAAALEVFAELGFERATLQDVADRAGVTKGALYHYFDSKDELFLELVRARVGDLVVASEARIAASADVPRAQLLRDYLEEEWRTLQQPHMLELARLILLELPKFPEVKATFFEEVVVPSRRTMRLILDRAVTEPPASDALVAALPGMVLGAAIAQRMYAATDPVQRDADAVGRTVVDTLVRGVLGPPAAPGTP
jgi:AcrR family transcriptional regulator